MDTKKHQSKAGEGEGSRCTEVPERTVDDASGSGQLEQVQFFSGNHCVEVTKGILHLFKEDRKTTIDPEYV